MWTSNLIFMLTWLSSIVGCKTNFLYANITGSGENVTVKATCVCDDYNDAIAWITPPQTEFLELLSANKTLRYVNFDWANKIWSVEPAYRGLFGPVVDYTWENMPIILTRATTPGEQYEYKEIRDIQILNQLELNFSFLGKSNAHIYLCSGVPNNANSCLDFILGSGKGNRSHIKLCKYNATKTCENLIEEIIHDHFFSENNWSQITIRYLNQQLQVIVNNKRLISLNSMNWNYTIEFQKYTKVSIHSNTENALWKYHEYSYYEDRRIHLAERSSTSLMFHVKSTYLCISFFANFQKEITIQLYDHSERLIETEKYSCKHSTQWNYKTFNTPVHENHEYFIVLQSSYGDIIAIRDMVIHDDCNTMDRFNHHISSLSFSLASIKNIKCSSLRHRSKHLTIHPADNKSHCKICSAKYHNTIQNSHRIICNEQLCYCSNGYIGNYCEKQCEDGRYGCNCVCKCGECVEGLCNPVNGECNLGCKNNYIEPYCIERNLPVITGIASIQSDCVTNCTIRIYDKELKYDGAQEPQYYYTRLIHPNNTVTERQITPVKVNVINFTNLIKDTKYNYQIVLCVGEKKSTCFKQELTIFQFETTCDELHNYQILIKSIEKETNIYVENYEPARNCFIQKYQMLILDEAGNTVQSATPLEVNNSVPSLKIFTNYTLRLIRNNKITNNIMFTTDDSKPLGVNDVKITSALASAFKIVWKEPLPVQGIITQYLVEWKFCGENDCLIGNEEHEIQSQNVTAAAIELNNLIPCSVYEISIYAFTKKGRSKVVKTTAYTDVINLDSYNYTVSSTSTSVQISFNVDCIYMKNPSLVIVNVTCKSDWCKEKVNKTSKQLTYKNDSVIVENLLPYTNYLLDIYLQFNQQISLNNFKIIGSQDFITLSSVPHKIPFADVYSLSETSLSIRWSAPYPPTGKLDTFIIQYGYNTEKETTFQNVTVLTSFCIIWPELFCLTLTDLKYNKTYTISITAQNQGIPYNASETVLSETTLVKVPQPPQHQIAFWSSTRFLQLEWKHPNKTNGPLLGFAISINGEKFFHKGLENLTYTYQTQFRCEPDNYQPTVTIQTVNSLFSSELLSDQFICPILQPSFSSLAFVKQINCHNFTVLLPTIENTETISFLYIVVLTSELDHTGDCRDSINSIHDSLISSKENQTCWIIEYYEQHEYKEIEDTELNINIPEMVEFNCTEELYEVGVLIVNELGDHISSNWYQLKLIEMSSLEVTELSLVTISLLVVFSSLLVIIIIVGPMCRYTLGMSHTNNRNVVYSEIPVLLSSSHYITSEVIPPPLPMKKTKSAANINEKCSRLVALADLHEYVRELADGDDFIAQHKKIVKLTPVNNEYHPVETAPECFNASYIASTLCRKAYILCSLASTSNLYYFWEMIIKEAVESIVLFATLADIKNERLSKYWPDYRSNRIVTYLDIEITALSVKTFHNYEMHNFIVKQSTRATKISFFHFINWAKRGTPMYPHNLTSFFQCLQKIEHSSQHPILVQNSEELDICASLFTLADICIRQAQEENHVDICSQVQTLRTQRANCIETVEEYLFAHLILVEYISMPQHAYPCEYYPIIYSTLDNEKLMQEMRNISESMWLVYCLQPECPILYHNDEEKNRDQSIRPDPSCCVFLRPLDEEDSCYINAIFVDGYQQTKKFIVTQHPLANTVDDFWRMVVESNVQLIISLQPEYDVKFWQNDGEFITPSGLSLKHLKILKMNGFDIHTLNLKLKEIPIKTIEVKLMEVRGWHLDQAVPQDLHTLLTTRLQMNRIKCQEFSSVLVMCRNGATASGLFIAMCNLLDCIESEHVVDVCTTVRNIRNNRREFVVDESQIRALFNVATLFLNDFENYANLGTIISQGNDKHHLKQV